MLRSILVGVLVLALVATGTGAAVALVTDDPLSGDATDAASNSFAEETPTASTVNTQLDEDPEFDRTWFEITVEKDGTATWTFRYERTLATDEEIEQFETFAEQLEDEETDFYVRFTEQAEALVSSGEEQTDREMTATDFERSAHVAPGVNDVGVVELSFTWTNFAVVEDDGRVVISDVFDGGFFLMEDQRLKIIAGDGLAFSNVRPEPEYAARNLENADAITWFGEVEFIDGNPYVVLGPEETVDEGATAGGFDSSSLFLAGGLLLALAATGAFAYVRYTRGGDTERDETPPPDHPDPTAVGAVDDTVTDEELLSDEDRVITLIRQNGGRIKQVNIVEETGWSKSKVSMLLSEMEEDGTISKLRVGRENIISLEGFEPEATKSPFDE